MNYSDFRNIHAGEKIVVCGCGTSSSGFLGRHEDFVTIGVNDLCRLFTPTYTVVVNDRTSFNDDRWRHIKSCGSKNIFTHLTKPEQLPVDNRSSIVQLKLGRHGGTSWQDGRVDYTSNSPYIAVLVAAWMGAKSVGVIGVDWTPDHFFAKTGDHSLSRRFELINAEYTRLHESLRSDGIELVNLSDISKLTIPKRSIKEF